MLELFEVADFGGAEAVRFSKGMYSHATLQAAGASAVERFVYKGVELTSTLAECGLTEDSSIEAKVLA